MNATSWCRRLFARARRPHPTSSPRRTRPTFEPLEDRSTPTVGYGYAFGIGGANYDYAQSVAVDAVGNTIVAGTFNGNVDFDPGPNTFYLSSNTNSDDVFVAKYSPTGAFLWAKQVGNANYESVSRVAVDSSGNVVLAGTFYGTVDFDPNAGTYNLNSYKDANNNFTTDVYVLKLTAAGEFAWAGQLGGAGYEYVYDVAVDGSGNVYAVGYFDTNGDYDPNPNTTYQLTRSSGYDAFVVKLTPDGRLGWARQTTDQGTANSTAYYEYANGVAVDAAGNVAVTGSFYGYSDYDPSAGSHYLHSTYNNGYTYDGFVWRLDQDGGFVWARSVGGLSSDYGYGIDIDGAGNVYVLGTFYDVATFYDPVVYNNSKRLTAAGGQDVYVAKLDAAGSYDWVRRIGGTNYDYARRLTLDNAGGVYLAGYFYGTLDFDPGPGTYNLTAVSNSYDAFAVKLGAAAGDLAWARRMGGTNFEFVNDIAADRAGNAYVAGYFQSTTADFSFGSANVGTVSNFATNGTYDGFVAKIAARADLMGRTANGYWWAGQTTGTSFTSAPVGMWPESGWKDTLTGDFNGDGRTDVLSRSNGDWWLAATTPEGNHENRLWGNWTETAEWKDVVAGDFNGDGLLDIAGRASNGYIWLGVNTGAGFANELWGLWSTAVTWKFVAAADMDRDGRADLIGFAHTGDWWVGRSTGQRFVNQLYSSWNPAAGWQDFGLGDFNGDGRTDVIARTAGGAWWAGIRTAATQVLPNQGFVATPWGTWNEAAGWRDIRYGDFNGDGRTDVAARTGAGQWWFGHSTDKFNFTSGAIWTESEGWADVLAADYDGDGRTDITGRNAAGQWRVITGKDTTTSTIWATWNASAGWRDLRAGPSRTGRRRT